jgi:sec-independent protein translocase protein TatA
MMGLGTPELLILLLVVLVLFGGAKLPKLARSIGQAQVEFKKGTGEGLVDERHGQPDPSVAEPSGDHVTMSREDLERLVDERAREARKEPPAQTD